MVSLAVWASVEEFEDTGCIIFPFKRVALNVATGLVPHFTLVLKRQRILARYTRHGIGWESGNKQWLQDFFGYKSMQFKPA